MEAYFADIVLSSLAVIFAAFMGWLIGTYEARATWQSKDRIANAQERING